MGQMDEILTENTDICQRVKMDFFSKTYFNETIISHQIS